jgi:hypothetical protein
MTWTQLWTRCMNTAFRLINTKYESNETTKQVSNPTLQLTSWLANVWVCSVLYYCCGVAFMI